MMPQTIFNGAKQFGLTLTQAQLDAFAQYSKELLSWNQRVNLTRITRPKEVDVKHFLDSLSVCLALSDLVSPFSLIDVGSGPGFPGLPLKIVLSDMRLTLLEATTKKTVFLRHIVTSLSLSKTTVLTARAEEAGQQLDHREQYDIAVARAVSALPVLAEYTLPLLKIGGLVIAQKGQNPTQEIDTANKALTILGGEVKQIIPVVVPGLEAKRHLIVIKKITNTPKQYPRRPGIPLKKPLI